MSRKRIGMIRDEGGRGVRVDRIDGWEPGHYGTTRVSLSGGGVIYLDVPTPEFVERLDRALTALHSPTPSAPAAESGQA